MKQKTSVYLDDLDREAVQEVGAYYGITSDTDVLCFSVRAVARAIPTHQKEGQVMTIPTQDNAFPARKQWQVDIFTSKDQTVPHTFYDQTLVALRKQVYSWLLTVQPTYIRSKSTYEKGRSNYWSPHYTERNESAYGEFCGRGLDIQKGPEYVEEGFIDGKFQLASVKKTLQNDMPDDVNQMLQRGWHIINLYQERDGPNWYVLGHTEAEAF